MQSEKVGITSELGEVLLGHNKIPVGELKGLLGFSGVRGWKVGFGLKNISEFGLFVVGSTEPFKGTSAGGCHHQNCTLGSTAAGWRRI